MYFVGDAKTIENVTKFVRDTQERRMSYSTANVQADVFLKAMSQVMPFPGDWYTGLNQLTSIYKLYYDGFLDQFQAMLGMQRIAKDVRSNYYSSVALIRLVNEGITSLFMHTFASINRCASQGDSDMTPAQSFANMPRSICCL